LPNPSPEGGFNFMNEKSKVNPQIENGHIDIANDIWEALTRIRIPGEA